MLDQKAGDMGFNPYGQKILQRLRADITGFAGGGLCSAEKKNQSSVWEMWKNVSCVAYDFYGVRG